MVQNIENIEKAAVEMVNNHNSSNGYDRSDFWKSEAHYIVALTGAKTAIYTLYYCNPKIVSMKTGGSIYKFVKILSTDLMVSVDEAIKISRCRPILVEPDEEIRRDIERHMAGTLTFGKYAGKHIDEIINEDIKYIYWLKSSLEKEAQNPKNIAGRTIYLSNKQYSLLQNINSSLELYYESVSNDNRKNIESSWLEEGKAENIEFTVDRIKILEDGNKKIFGHNGSIYYMIFLKDIDSIEVGNTIHIGKCRINAGREYMGIKYNYLNYVKNIKIN